MARSIIVSLDGAESSFGFSRLDRAKLYATRKRLPLDSKGNACKRAELADDGSMLISSGMTGQGYFDDGGRWVPNKELVGLDDDGNEVEQQPSTMGVAQKLEEVGPEAVLDALTASIYMLDGQEVDDNLKAALDEGKIFRFPFNLRADYHMETAYLLSNDNGIFVLLGDTVDTPWCELDKPALLVEDEDEGEDDSELDFEMF